MSLINLLSARPSNGATATVGTCDSRGFAHFGFVLLCSQRCCSLGAVLEDAEVTRAAVCWSTRLDVSSLLHRALPPWPSLRCAARPLCAPWSVPIAVVACSCCTIQRVILLSALSSLNVQEGHSFACADIHPECAAAARSRTNLFGAVSAEHRGAPPPRAVRCRPAESQCRVRLQMSPNLLWRCMCVQYDRSMHGYAWHAQPTCLWRVAPSGVNIVRTVNNRGVNDPFAARYLACFF